MVFNAKSIKVTKNYGDQKNYTANSRINAQSAAIPVGQNNVIAGMSKTANTKKFIMPPGSAQGLQHMVNKPYKVNEPVK